MEGYDVMRALYRVSMDASGEQCPIGFSPYGRIQGIPRRRGEPGASGCFRSGALDETAIG